MSAEAEIQSELAGDLIAGGDRERTGGADQLLDVAVEMEHGKASLGEKSRNGDRIGAARAQSN